MSVIGIPVVIGVLGTVPKGLERGLKEMEIGERNNSIQTTALLRSVRILRRILETRRDLLSPVKCHQPTLVGKTGK